MAKTLKDIQKMIKDNGIKMVDFKLTDIDGRWRHLSIPAERLTESTMEHGIGFDGSNYARRLPMPFPWTATFAEAWSPQRLSP